MSSSSVFVTTFLAAAVEVIEMVIIVVGVGSMRGWRSTWLGAGAGLGVLAVLVVALGTALQAVPIGALRVVIGSLLLVFGLQWLRKGIARVSTGGLRGMGERTASAEGVPASGVDWTAFVLAFKGVLLEGLEITLWSASASRPSRWGAPCSARRRRSWSSRALACWPLGWCSASRAAPCNWWWERCCRALGRSGRCRASGSPGRAATPRFWFIIGDDWTVPPRWRLRWW